MHIKAGITRVVELEENKRPNYRLDTDRQVFCHMDEFYCLSNFSPFRLIWRGHDFDTSEHAYHWEKFNWHSYSEPTANHLAQVKNAILKARSAHEAFQIAQRNSQFKKYGWDKDKTLVMREILLAKLGQHEYVYKKLLETGDREIIEDSWRDPFWGWGPDKQGENMLGKIWQTIRGQIK